MTRTARLMLLLVAVPVALGACRKKQAPVVPEPLPPATVPAPTPPAPAPAAPPVDTMIAYRAAVAAAREALTRVIYFDYDSDELTAEARAALDARIPVMNANPDLRIRIEGHCDERGTDEYNLVLGRRRAEQAKRYLTDRGIDASRIETMSFGRERPAVQGSGEDAWSRNRRDEFAIVAGGDNLRPAR
jgi:peptidoglycan-associated lipoprotein